MIRLKKGIRLHLEHVVSEKERENKGIGIKKKGKRALEVTMENTEK